MAPGRARRGRCARLGVALALGLGALVAPVLTAGPASGGAYPGDNGLIAFARDTATGEDITLAIFTVDPATGAVTGPLGGGQLDSEPEWSPDGTRIAFASLRAGGDNRLYVMDADGSNVVALTPTGDDGNSCPTWSPDGTQIAYSDGDGDIVIIPSDGGAPVATFPLATCELSWSPLGDRIAFVDAGGISFVDVATGVVTPFTTNPDDAHPTWSPDGTRLAFSRFDGSQTRIFVAPVDDPGAALPVSPGPDDGAPAWSPDGTEIVFVIGTAGGRLARIPAEGGAATFVTDPTADELDAQPDWQPLPGPPPPPPPPVPVPVKPTFTG